MTELINKITYASLGMLVLSLPSAYALHLLSISNFSWQSTLACAILIFVAMVVASTAKTEIEIVSQEEE